ncbi:MAG TPA: PAS domain-containing sensor histidine kinase [Proteobacteria bacterium]|nr:PAS domain-containing sensor histidine kinase [Pseudomonadota bacterium]
MAEEYKTPEERCAELERLLHEAREEVRHYQRIAKDTGRRRLREIDQLSRFITEHKRAEEALRRSEQKFKDLTEATTDWVWEVDAQGVYTYASPKIKDLLGYEVSEVVGKTPFDLMPEEAEKICKFFNAKVINKEPFYGLENVNRHKDGHLVVLETNGIPIFDEKGQLKGYRGIDRDITKRKRVEEEKKRLEAQFHRAQKMEAIGTLAAGTAHDFNNLLMGIQGNVSLMLLDIDSSRPHYKKLKSIQRQVQSGAKLTGQLLGYARKGRYEVKPIDLNKLINEVSETFGRTRKEINIHRELAGNLLAIEADQGQIEQVLLNLFVNAADAMPGGGDLILKTRNTTYEEMRGNPYDPKPGHYVLLTVTDTGIGMDKKTMERIFDPFFTSKELGRGTGLGLASVYGIIKGHDGYIGVDSNKGYGTAFSIYMPASEKAVQESVKTTDGFIKGTETVLLVDDEEVIRKVGQAMLQATGYRALTAKDGIEAIEVYRNHRDDIDLVLLDMVMPNMGGGETYDTLKEINSDIRVLLSSGYSIEGQATEILKRGCNGFIQKPFTIKQLSKKIREILGKG